MRVLLLYPPLQFAAGAVPKPDGSLSLPYLAGELRRRGHEVAILDCTVGRDGDDLSETFDRREPLTSGLVRVGMSDERIVREVAGWDAVGITSIFTPQSARALALVRLLRAAYPQLRIWAGGVNAKFFKHDFLEAGCDAVCLTEGERAIAALAAGQAPLDVPGVAFRHLGMVRTNPAPPPLSDLDELAPPAWDLQPLGQYAAVGRPHGRGFGDQRVRYAEMMTSRGCPFSCSYCHISRETATDESGNIGRFRVKSIARVLDEAHTLRSLGVEYVFIEDDSLLAKRARAMEIFEGLSGLGLKFADINGVNIAHLFTRAAGGLVPDDGLLSHMRRCGFDELSLPFESGSQRVLNEYASGKWAIERHDTIALVESVRRAGLRASGNYTIGYPDESMEEIYATLRMARDHVAAGLDEVNIFLIVPFPGSALFDRAVAGGYLPENWQAEDMRWFLPTMVKTTVPPEQLKTVRDLAWNLLNPSRYIAERRAVAVPERSI